MSRELYTVVCVLQPIIRAFNVSCLWTDKLSFMDYFCNIGSAETEHIEITHLLPIAIKYKIIISVVSTPREQLEIFDPSLLKTTVYDGFNQENGTFKYQSKIGILRLN